MGHKYLDGIKGKSLQKASPVQDRPKFSVGDRSDSYENFKHMRPVFAFDYLSLNGSDFCFDGRLLGRGDYVSLMKGLKRISSQRYKDLNDDDMFHFHDIEWGDVSIKESDFKKCIGDESEDITAYQFKVFGKARVIGFVYMGVFYLVMFDIGHNAYRRK